MISKEDNNHVRFSKKIVAEKGLAVDDLLLSQKNWLDYGISMPGGKKIGIHAPKGEVHLEVDGYIKVHQRVIGG